MSYQDILKTLRDSNYYKKVSVMIDRLKKITAYMNVKVSLLFNEKKQEESKEDVDIKNKPNF